MKRKLYIACALTHAPPEFRQMIFKLRGLLETAGFEVLPFGWINGPRQDINIYRFDMEKVERADAMIAVCDYPSIGLGMELEHCRHVAISPPTVLAFVRKGTVLSKIVSDFLEHFQFPTPVSYEREEDIVFEVSARQQAMFAYGDGG